MTFLTAEFAIDRANPRTQIVANENRVVVAQPLLAARERIVVMDVVWLSIQMEKCVNLMTIVT